MREDPSLAGREPEGKSTEETNHTGGKGAEMAAGRQNHTPKKDLRPSLESEAQLLQSQQETW